MMARDCFGNPTPFPPSISDTHADIQRYAHLPFDVRMNYHYLRTDAMVGRASAVEAWAAFYALTLGSRSEH